MRFTAIAMLLGSVASQELFLDDHRKLAEAPASAPAVTSTSFDVSIADQASTADSDSEYDSDSETDSDSDADSDSEADSGSADNQPKHGDRKARRRARREARRVARRADRKARKAIGSRKERRAARRADRKARRNIKNADEADKEADDQSMAERLRSRFNSFVEKIITHTKANGKVITENRQAKIAAKRAEGGN